MGHYTEEITRNAEKINQLNARIKETLKFRDKIERKRKEWRAACAEFHEQYDSLAFPGRDCVVLSKEYSKGIRKPWRPLFASWNVGRSSFGLAIFFKIY